MMEPREKDQKEQKEQKHQPDADNLKSPVRGVVDESKKHNQRPTQDPDGLENDPEERERKTA
jgi:hypothetical protein